MNYGLSDQVRALAEERFVQPAIQAGKAGFSIAVRDLMAELQTKGFPTKNWPQICTAIQAEKFLRANGIEIEAVEGPPSKMSTTVVVRYRMARNVAPAVESAVPNEEGEEQGREELPEEWAHRVTSKIQGLLKDEIAQFGGAEGFLRWVRSDDGEMQ
jgi:hypothetical protein